MSVAAATRAAVREHPILLDALRAGVVNYTAAAAWLTSRADLDGDTDAVAAALRRLSEDLPALARASRSARVSMQTGVAGETLVVVVSRRDGATAVRVVEDVLAGEKAAGEKAR